MKRTPPRSPRVEVDGWALASAEARNAEHPDSFPIPSRDERENLAPGDAAKLLFDIETRDADGQVMDRGVDRMWVIVERRVDSGYVGLLDSDPGHAAGLRLRPGVELTFGPEHVVEIARPPRTYLIEKYGKDFRTE